MTHCKEKIVGILGGMGPEATVDLMHRIIKNTPATDDIDHIRCIVDNNPKVPSRIKALIEGTGEDPGPCMADMGKRLAGYGADFLVIACNTAHNYHGVVQQAVEIPVFNMIELAVEACLAAIPHLKKVGILASPAVRTTQLYARPFAARGVDVIYPVSEAEAELFAIIRAVKAGDTTQTIKDRFTAVLRNVADQGAEVGIIACTELSAIAEACAPLPIIDASEVLAQAVVKAARSCERE